MLASPRTVTLRLRVKPQPHTTKTRLALLLREKILNDTEANLKAAPQRPGGFVTQLGADTASLLPRGAIESVSCLPESPELECSSARIAVAESGVYVKIGDVNIEWVAPGKAPNRSDAAAPR